MIRPRPLQTLLGMAAGIALAGGGYAVAATTSSRIHACANTKTHMLSLETNCPRGSRALVWNVRGPAGRAGTDGRNGTNGTSVTLNPGVNVTEVSPSPSASASITQGADGHDTLNLSIPQGATGIDRSRWSEHRPECIRRGLGRVIDGGARAWLGCRRSDRVGRYGWRDRQGHELRRSHPDRADHHRHAE